MTPPLSPDNYARVAAITTHANLKRAIERDLPALTCREQDEVFAAIIVQVARMRGLTINGASQ